MSEIVARLREGVEDTGVLIKSAAHVNAIMYVAADELESANRRAEYWKAEQIAGNEEIERLLDHVAILEDTIAKESQCLKMAPAWHEGHRAAIEALRMEND